MKTYLAILATGLPLLALGVTAAMHGEAADAPGLALIGIVLIVATFAIGVRLAQRSG